MRPWRFLSRSPWAGSAWAGALTCPTSEAERGQGQQGEEHKGFHGVSGSGCVDSASLLLPASSTVLYPLGCAPEAGVRAGHRGACQGCLGLIRLSSVGQTPKEVVVGAVALWVGPGSDGGGFASIRDCQPPETVPSSSPRGRPRSPSPTLPLSPSLGLSHQWGRLGGEGGEPRE